MTSGVNAVNKLESTQVKAVYVMFVALSLIIIGVIGFSLYYLNSDNPVDPIQDPLMAWAAPKHLATVYGDQDVMLGESRSVFVDDDRIYISDTSNHRVVVFDYNGKFLSKFGDVTQGDWPGMSFPYGLTKVDDRIYVADAGAMRVLVFDLEGNFLSYFATDILIKPVNIVFHDEHFYITDVSRQQIVILDREGKEVLSFGRFGREGKPGELNYPNGLAVDESGQIYVADTNNSRIQVFNNDGEFLASWQGKDDSGAGFLTAPMNVTLDRENNLYVADPITKRIIVLNQEGTVSYIIKNVPEGRNTGSFSLPSGVYVDSNDQLFISDTGNRRLVIYDLK